MNNYNTINKFNATAGYNVLSFQLNNEVGAALQITSHETPDEKTDNVSCSYEIALVSKSGKIINKKILDLPEIVFYGLQSAALDMDAEAINFELKNGTTVSCDLAELFSEISKHSGVEIIRLGENND